MFLISFVLLIGIVLYSNPSKLLLNLSQANLYFILLALLVTLIGTCFRVYRWEVLVDIDFKKLFPIQLFGMVFSHFTPGKVGEPLKAIVLKAYTNKNVSESLSSVIWERIFDLVILVVLSLLSIQILSFSSQYYLIGILSVLLFLAIVIILFLVLYKESLGRRIFILIKKIPFIPKLSDSFINNFYSYKIQKRKLSLSFLLTTVPWILEGVTFYFVLLSLNVTISPLLLAGIVALATLIGVASSLPGGIGSAEIVMTLLLTLNGVEPSLSVSLVLIYRFVSFWFSVLLGGLSFMYLSRKIDIKQAFKDIA